MRKLLLLTALLAISLAGCKKETSLNTEGHTKSYKQTDLTRYRPYYSYDLDILNQYYNEPWFLLGFDHSNNEDRSVFIHNRTDMRRRWGIEYISMGQKAIVKFWSFGVLAVDSFPRPDGSLNVVHKYTEEYYVADWELIGLGNPLADYGESPSSFIGVLVNIKTGKMLEANKSKSGRIDVFVSKKWEGSELQKMFEKDGDWSNVLASQSTLKKCLWKIDDYYRREAYGWTP